jgi:hypothetical protein
MATKRNAQAAPAAATPAETWNAALDLPRQQMTLATEGACAMFQGFESMRRIQEQAAHEALMHYTKAAQRLKEANDLAQLLEIQAELMRFDLDGATRYWQQIGEVAVVMQNELANRFGHLANNGGLAPAAMPTDSLQALATNWLQFFKGNARSEAS